MEGKLAKLPEMVDIKLVKNSKVKAILLEIINASSIEIISTDKKKAKVESVQKEKSITKTRKVTKKKVSKKTDEKKSKPNEKEQAKPTKKKQKKSITKKTKKCTKKKSSTELDRFGTRVGTYRAKINEALSTTPQTRMQIITKTGKQGSCSSHLKKLIVKGFLKQLKDKTYQLIK